MNTLASGKYGRCFEYLAGRFSQADRMLAGAVFWNPGE